MNLAEIGEKFKEKRVLTGLTQAQAGKVAGLSRVTINKLENGNLPEIGFNKLNALLNAFGLGVDVSSAKGINNGLSIAARTAGTSYKNQLTPEMLADILSTGSAPEKYHAHLIVLMDEAPLAILLKAIKDTAKLKQVSPNKIVKNLVMWGREWRVHNAVWH